MANNIVGGAPNAIVAKNTVDFVTAGLTALNTAIIFEVGNPLKSYVPGRSINAISGFTADKGYYLVALQDMDLSTNVVPPIAGGGGGGGGFDTDAQAFFTASGVTDNTQKTAVNNLVLALKGASIWAKMRAVYPFVGGTSTTNKFNLKNPLDSDAAFRLSFSGGITHGASGIIPASGGSILTHLTPSVNLTLNSTHMAIYVNSTAGTDYMVAAQDSNHFTLAQVSNIYNRQYNDTTGQVLAPDPGPGFIVGTRTGAATLKTFANGSQIGTTQSGASGALPAVQVAIGSVGIGGTTVANDSMTRSIQFVSIGDGLTDSEVVSLTNAVSAMQTALSRA